MKSMKICPLQFLSTKLGPLSISKLLILLVVFGGATVGTYYAAGRIDTTSSTAITADEQLVPARLGDLTNVVSTDGSITFPVVESVEFESQGQVGEVLVVEGDKVTSGQVIARLDAESVAALEKRVADARVKLRDTQEKLDDTRIIDPLALATAEEAVAKSALTIQKAADDLVDIRIVDPLALAKAKEDVAKSTLAVQKATDDLATMTAHTLAEELADAQALERAGVAGGGRDQLGVAAVGGPGPGPYGPRPIIWAGPILWAWPILWARPIIWARAHYYYMCFFLYYLWEERC